MTRAGHTPSSTFQKRSAIEELEGRALMSITLASGVLSLTGGDVYPLNQINVTLANGQIAVDHRESQYQSGDGDWFMEKSQFNVGDVKKIIVKVSQCYYSSVAVSPQILAPCIVTSDGDFCEDYISTGGGNDSISAGGGDDDIQGNGGNDLIDGMNGNDRIWGGDGNDVLRGSAGDDIVDGGNGNDTLDGWIGNDQVIGGAGVDTLDCSGRRSAVSVDLRQVGTPQTISPGERDRFSGLENVTGGWGNDRLIGSASAKSVLIGNAGNDYLESHFAGSSLIGGAGNDRLNASNGLRADIVNGGTGTDTAMYDASDIVTAVEIRG